MRIIRDMESRTTYGPIRLSVALARVVEGVRRMMVDRGALAGASVPQNLPLEKDRGTALPQASVQFGEETSKRTRRQPKRAGALVEGGG